MDSQAYDERIPAPRSVSRGNRKVRHAHVRTPSEEDELTFDGSRRPSTPYALRRQKSWIDDDTSSDKDTSGEQYKKRARKRKHSKAVLENGAAPDSIPAAAVAPPPPTTGPQPFIYHNPAGNPNPAIHLHNGAILSNVAFSGHPQATFGLPTATNHYQPVHYAIQANSMEGNYIYGDRGLNFQPQVPDTSMGPMLHQHIPPGAGGQVYVVPIGLVPHGASGPLRAGITTVPMQPIPVMSTQPLPGQPMHMGGVGPMSAGQPPMMVPMAGGGMGGGMGGGVPGIPVLLNGGAGPPGVPGTYPTNIQYGGNGNMVQNNPPLPMYDPKLNEPQDFKPADEDPARMYMVRQLDQQFVPMSRATIDSFGDGARWYVTDDGVFYAVRLDA
ncbi:unnamed protein product [Discula destructiva]